MKEKLSPDEYRAYCMKIIRGNLAQFAARSRNAFAGEPEALRRVQEELGIRAKERGDG
jgi:hypothetical protein